LLWLLMALGSGFGYVASLVIAAFTARRIATTLDGVDSGPRDVANLAARGLGSAALQLASAICRHYWPVALVAAVLFRRFRHVVLIAAVLDGVADWVRRRDNVEVPTKQLGVVPYLVLKRLDDLAYGAGMWTGMVQERNPGPLKPQIRT
jgi:mycofactocin glycosyltransferase